MSHVLPEVRGQGFLLQLLGQCLPLAMLHPPLAANKELPRLRA